MNSVKQRLLEFLRDHTGQGELHAGTELVEEGIVDSLTMMDLMVFIESEFNVRLEIADLNAAVFRTPVTLASTIEMRQAQLCTAEPVQVPAAPAAEVAW